MADAMDPTVVDDEETDSSEEDSEDRLSVWSYSSEEPPQGVKNKQLWKIHAKLLRKAGLSSEHATLFKLDRVTDIGHAMINRLPRGRPGRASRLVETFEPAPKNKVIALITDIMAEPRGRGLKCLHGTDTDGYTKNLKGWKPPREQRQSAEFVDIWKRQLVRKRHKHSRVMRAKIRRRHNLELAAAAAGEMLPPPAWELKYLRNQAREAAERRSALEKQGKYDEDEHASDSGSGSGANMFTHGSDDESLRSHESGSDDGGRQTRDRLQARPEDAEDPGEVIKRMSKNNGPYKRKPRKWNWKRDAKRKYDQPEIPYDPFDDEDTKHRKKYPRVYIKHPRGNVVWKHGDKQYVQWLCTAKGVSYMKLELFNGVHKVAVMAPRRSNSNGVHFVTVPEEWGEGREFRIKVSAVDDPSVFAFSPAFLAILPSKAEVRRREQRAARQEEKRKARVKKQLGITYESSDEEDELGHHKVVTSCIGSRLVPPKPKRGLEGKFVAKQKPKFKYIVNADDYSNYTGERNKRGRPHGFGTRTYMCTGGQYTGEWKNGLRHGHGMLEIPQGVKYDGDWENDKMHGQGILILANGTKYTGTFAHGKRHGRGKLECGNGFKYEGMFKEGEFHGHGTAIGGMDSGVAYTGRWQSGKVCGMGRLTFGQGETEQRIWDRRSFGSSLKGLYSERDRAKAEAQARFDHINRVHKELLLDDLVWETRKEIQKKKAEERARLIALWKEQKRQETQEYKWAAKRAARAMASAT